MNLAMPTTPSTRLSTDPDLDCAPALDPPAPAAATAVGTRIKAAAPASANLWRQHFRKIAFGTHAPGGKRKVAEIKATLHGEEIADKRVSSSQVAMIPEELITKIEHARANIFKVLERYTFPCGEKAHRLVSVRHSQEFIQAFELARMAFDATADAVADQFEAILEYNRSFWRPKFATEEEYQAAIGRRLPADRDTFRAAFSVTIRDLEDIDEDAPAFFTDELIADFFAEAKRNAVALHEELREALHTEPIARLASQCEKILTAAEGPTRITLATLDQLTAAIQLYMSCADVMNPAFTAKVSGLAQQLGKVKQNAEARHATGGTYTAPLKAALKKMAAGISDLVDAAGLELAQHAAAAPVRQDRNLVLHLTDENDSATDGASDGDGAVTSGGAAPPLLNLNPHPEE